MGYFWLNGNNFYQFQKKLVRDTMGRMKSRTSHTMMCMFSAVSTDVEDKIYFLNRPLLHIQKMHVSNDCSVLCKVHSSELPSSFGGLDASWKRYPR